MHNKIAASKCLKTLWPDIPQCSAASLSHLPPLCWFKTLYVDVGVPTSKKENVREVHESHNSKVCVLVQKMFVFVCVECVLKSTDEMKWKSEGMKSMKWSHNYHPLPKCAHRLKTGIDNNCLWIWVNCALFHTAVASKRLFWDWIKCRGGGGC